MKAKALKTLMVSGKVYLEGQEIPSIEGDQYQRLLEVNAIEATTKPKRKRRTKAQMASARIDLLGTIPPSQETDSASENLPSEGSSPKPEVDTSVPEDLDLPL